MNLKNILYWLLNTFGWLGVCYILVSSIFFNISNYNAYQYYAQHPYYIEFFPEDIQAYKLFFYYSLANTIVGVAFVFWEFRLLKRLSGNGLIALVLAILNLLLSSCIFYYSACNGLTPQALLIAIMIYVVISLILIAGVYWLNNHKNS